MIDFYYNEGQKSHSFGLASKGNSILNTAYIDKNHTLVERCRQNDRLAQSQLYNNYCDAMYNIALRMVSNEEDARDVLQNAFVSAFTSISQFSGKVSFGAWLKRIVINKCLDHLKKRKLQIVDIDSISYKISNDVQEEEEVIAKATPAMIHSKIKELPTGSRLVFNLYMLEGYDHKEIAEILKISESTSKSQYSRAKKLLKKMLEA